MELEDEPEKLEKILHDFIEKNKVSQSAIGIDEKISEEKVIVNTKTEGEQQAREQKQQTDEQVEDRQERNEDLNNLLSEAKSDADTVLQKNNLTISQADREAEEDRLKTDKESVFHHLPPSRTAEQRQDYIYTSAANRLILENPNVSEADKSQVRDSFRRLERTLCNEAGIKTETQHSFSAKNFSQTSGIIFDTNVGNRDLINRLTTQTKDNASEYTKLLKDGKEATLADLDEQYGKLDPQRHATYEAIIQKPESTRTQQEQERLLRYQEDYLLKLKEMIDNQTKTTLEQVNVLWPVIGLAGYLNLPVGTDFSFNASKDIRFDEKTNYLSVTGMVNGNPSTLRTNLAEKGKLETTDYLSAQGGNTFKIGTDAFQATPYTMPTQNEIREQIWASFTAHQQELRNQHTPTLSPSHTPNTEKYQAELQTLLFSEIQKLYDKQASKDDVQLRVERQIGKDAAAQELFTGLKSLMNTERNPQFLGPDNLQPDGNAQPHPVIEWN